METRIARMCPRPATALAAGVLALALGGLAADAAEPAGEAASVYGIQRPPGYRIGGSSASPASVRRSTTRAKLGNDIAIAAYRDGTRPFADGSVIVGMAWH